MAPRSSGSRDPERRQTRRLRNPLGSWLLGSGQESARRLRWRVQLLLTFLLVFANIIGSAMTTGLLLSVIPGRSIFTPELFAVTFIWAPAYALGAIIVGSIWGTTWIMSSLRWSRLEKRATRADRISTLRVPWKLTLVSGVLWGGGMLF